MSVHSIKESGSSSNVNPVVPAQSALSCPYQLDLVPYETALRLTFYITLQISLIVTYIF